MKKSIFSSVSVQIIAENLVDALYILNKNGYSCGMGEDQVYGCAYKALKNLLVKEFGEIVTQIAMNSKTWCCSDFENQIIPAIEEAIIEAKEIVLEEKANKMADFLIENNYNAWVYDENTISILKGVDLEGIDIVDKIKIDWNDVHEYLELNHGNSNY